MSYAFGPILRILCGGFTFLAFGGIGVFVIYKAYRTRQQADASQGWPAVRGELTDARVDRSTDSDGGASYIPRLRYTYQVSGTTFTGDKITFGFHQSYGSEAKAQAVLQRYPVGSNAMVYYNPANPGEAVLERAAGGFGVSLVIGIVFLLIATCIVLLFLLSSIAGTSR